MIELAGTEGRTYAVMGLGASGIATVEALHHAGARVLAWDDSEARREAATHRGVTLTDLGATDLRNVEALVLSPGIPHTHPSPHPLADRARMAGVPIICDVELLLKSAPDARVIGITGTNGKSTVTALIGHILECAGVPCAIGGNLGPAALGLEAPEAGGAFVLELSSYQIERIMTAGFDLAVLINITADHLDRHGGMAGYVAAKERLFSLMRPGAIAVVGVDDTHSRAMAARARNRGDLRVIPVSAAGHITGGVYVEQSRVIDATDTSARLIADISSAETLPGVHNRQNAAAATAAALAFGIATEAIAKGLHTYPGLPHRQEKIRTLRHVDYINDSKATNPDAALRALDCYDNIFWIAGGLAKEGGFDSLLPALPRIRHAFLIGEAATTLANMLGEGVPHSISVTLQAAVAEAHKAAQRSGRDAVVLLSPACASFDQFLNFEARGDEFRKLVAALPEHAGGAA